MTRKVELKVNGNQLELNPYVEAYVYYVTEGIIKSLKGTGPIKTLLVDIDSDELVTIVLNGNGVSVNEFVIEIIRNTYAGMVLDLKDVDGDAMKTLTLNIAQ